MNGLYTPEAVTPLPSHVQPARRGVSILPFCFQPSVLHLLLRPAAAETGVCRLPAGRSASSPASVLLLVSIPRRRPAWHRRPKGATLHCESSVETISAGCCAENSLISSPRKFSFPSCLFGSVTQMVDLHVQRKFSDLQVRSAHNSFFFFFNFSCKSEDGCVLLLDIPTCIIPR